MLKNKFFKNLILKIKNKIINNKNNKKQKIYWIFLKIY